MVELAYTLVLETSEETLAGSNPAMGTKPNLRQNQGDYYLEKINPEKNKEYQGIDALEELEGRYNKCPFYNNVFIDKIICEKKCKALIAYYLSQIGKDKLPSCAIGRKLDDKYMSAIETNRKEI